MFNLTFNKTAFLKTILVFIALSATWTILCIAFDEFTERDKGLVTGFGFLVVLSIALYSGQQRKGWKIFGGLLMLVILTFLVGSFFLGTVVGLSTNSMGVYAVVNAAFVSIVMTFFLNKWVGISLPIATIIVTFLSLVLAYFLIDRLGERILLDYGINERLTMFNLFQSMLVLGLGVGMNLRRAHRS